MKNKVEVICEIGWNHGGNIGLAKSMIGLAKQSGATYAKFQSWSVKRLKPGPWDTDGRREIYEKAELSRKNHIELADFCKDQGIKFMSSVFAIEDAKMLVTLRLNESVKIPSFESRNFELIEYCLNNFHKVFISFGTATSGEIAELCNRFKDKLGKIVPMHCVSSYPLDAKNANIKRMNLISTIFDTDVYGYSDHMEGVESAKVAIELGASVIEKHFTIDNDLPGRDNKFACLPHQIKDLTDYIKLREDMISFYSPDYQKCEEESRTTYTGRFDEKEK